METANGVSRQVIQKVCVLCGRDVSQEKRTKDASGRYFCAQCLANVNAGMAAKTLAKPPQAAAVAFPPPIPPPAPSTQPMTQEPTGRSLGWVIVGGLSMLATLFLLAVVIGIKDDPSVEQAAVAVTTLMLIAFNVFSVIAFAVSDPKTSAAVCRMLPQSLQDRAIELGNVKGLPYTQIASALGTPSSVSRIGAQSLITWSERRYTVSLLFQGHGEEAICLSVESEHTF